MVASLLDFAAALLQQRAQFNRLSHCPRINGPRKLVQPGMPRVEQYQALAGEELIEKFRKRLRVTLTFRIAFQ